MFQWLLSYVADVCPSVCERIHSVFVCASPRHIWSRCDLQFNMGFVTKPL